MRHNVVAPVPDPTPTISQYGAPSTAAVAPEPEVRPLSFSGTIADPQPDYHASKGRQSALNAAALSLVTALMLAAGLVVLLALLF